jgi:hypothetical protein
VVLLYVESAWSATVPPVGSARDRSAVPA